ncbi:MAG: family intrarane metalloprotease protein [Crocinitomicaceae bacterium]|jgi:membrane protease YdiL (CAAX protease family)|nr:family intrarane metalloprotease protein [Crocinitomicaceae bacterium]
MPEQHAAGKNQFVPVLLTVLFSALALMVSSSVPGLIYLSASGEETFKTADLVSYYGKNLFFFLQLLPFAFTLITLLLCVRFVHREKPLSMITSAGFFRWKRALLSFFIWLLVLFVFLLFELLQENQLRWNYSSSFWPLLAFSLVLVTLQTAFEEIFFRGYLFKYAFPSANTWLPILLTSLLFGLMHLGNPEIGLLGKIVLVYYFGTGIFLALMAVLDRGLELSLGFHAANNLFATLILTNNWQVFQTDALFKDYSAPSVSPEIWLNLLVLFPLLLFLYAKIFRWDFGLIFAKFAKNTKR